MKYLNISIAYIFFFCSILLSQYSIPERIVITGEYTNDSTKVRYPVTIGQFIREGIYSSDSSKNNISVDYRAKIDNTLISVSVYPAGKGYEDRLLHEYFKSLKSIAIIADKEISAEQHPFPYEKNGYRVLGLVAKIRDSFHLSSSMLTIFECGKWFLKFRISLDSSQYNKLEGIQKSFLKVFSPSDIVRRYPLNQKSNILVAPAAFDDSLFLYTVMASAFKKSEWVLKNVDTLERCSGCPGLYLKEHTVAIETMVEKGRNTRLNSVMGNSTYFRNLVKIVDSGFLNEFVMSEYSMLLITPKDIKLNMEGYENWAKTNSFKFDLSKKYYLIEYLE